MTKNSIFRTNYNLNDFYRMIPLYYLIVTVKIWRKKLERPKVMEGGDKISQLLSESNIN